MGCLLHSPPTREVRSCKNNTGGGNGGECEVRVCVGGGGTVAVPHVHPWSKHHFAGHMREGEGKEGAAVEEGAVWWIRKVLGKKKTQKKHDDSLTRTRRSASHLTRRLTASRRRVGVARRAWSPTGPASDPANDMVCVCRRGVRVEGRKRVRLWIFWQHISKTLQKVWNQFPTSPHFTSASARAPLRETAPSTTKRGECLSVMRSAPPRVQRRRPGKG
jgi:hypothetical protein